MESLWIETGELSGSRIAKLDFKLRLVMLILDFDKQVSCSKRSKKFLSTSVLNQTLECLRARNKNKLKNVLPLLHSLRCDLSYKRVIHKATNSFILKLVNEYVPSFQVF